MNKARAEPDFTEEQLTEAYSIIRSVLFDRLSLCERYQVSLERTRAIVSPLEALYMRVEIIILGDPGTFGEQPSYPPLFKEGWGTFQISSWGESIRKWDLYQQHKLRLSAPYLRILVNFMDNLGRARHAVYKERREAIDAKVRPVEPYESIFPWGYTIEGDLLQNVSLEDDAPYLSEYLNDVSTYWRRGHRLISPR